MDESALEDIQVIFFDLDDTLFDQQKAHRRALRKIRDEFQIFKEVGMKETLQAFEEADSEAIEEFKEGIPMEDLRFNRSEKFLKKVGVDPDFAETFHEEFYRIYPSITVNIKGAEEVVKELGSRYRLGILSNSTKKIQMKKLRALELTEYFDTFIFSEEVGYRKPDEDIFLQALDAVDERAERCMYVGNSYMSDVKGSKKVGMRTCWLNRNGEKKGGGVEPDVEIKELRELLEML